MHETPKKAQFRHGTLYSYQKRGCRCEVCTAKNRESKKNDRQKHTNNPIPPDAKHGTAHVYREYGCRCELCTEEYLATFARKSNRYVNLSVFQSFLTAILVKEYRSHPDLIASHFETALKQYRKADTHDD